MYMQRLIFWRSMGRKKLWRAWGSVCPPPNFFVTNKFFRQENVRDGLFIKGTNFFSEVGAGAGVYLGNGEELNMR
jgi:hypothetical protein